jgi:hypothetical protein
MPRLLREIVEGIVVVEDDLELTGTLPAPESLSSLDDGDAPDVVITAESPAVGDAVESLLDRFPRVRVLAVAGEGRYANVYRLRPCRERIGNLSPDSLLAAVRGRP